MPSIVAEPPPVRIPMSPRGSAPAVFGWAAIACAGLLAALAAHWSIDIAGDYALRRDTYDHIAHHSRLIAVIAAALLALVSTALIVWAALRDVRRFRGALDAVLGRGARASAAGLIARLVPSTCAMLVAMESIDGWLDTGRLPTLTDAFGGSLLLGGAIAITAGVLAALAVWRLLRCLHAMRRSIAAVICRLLIGRARVAGTVGLACSVATNRLLTTRGSLLARRLGLRAPPLRA